MKIRAYITHKIKERDEDCQDAYSINEDNKSIAVSDGMSQSIFSGLWAKLITKSFADGLSWNGSEQQIHEVSETWQQEVNAKLQEEKEKGEDPWMLENLIKERKGAGATLCGIRFNGEEWKGIVLGDTSLVEINSEDEIERIQKTPDPEGEFDNHPDYFDSYEKGKGKPKEIKGRLKVKDKLLIVSDPIGELLFKKKQEGNASGIIRDFLKIDSHEAFCALVDDLRNTEKMHNDDSTIVIIENDDGSDKFQIIHQDDIKGKKNGDPNEGVKEVAEMQPPVEEQDNSKKSLS